MHPRLLGPASLAVLCLSALGCGEQPTGVDSPPDVSLTKGMGNQPSIPLVVTVVPTANMTSDGITEPGYGAGEYVSGINGMIVEFDGPGNLQFSPANGNNPVPPLRTLGLSYGAQLTTPNGPWNPNLYMGNQHNFKIVTNNANLPRIQDLAVGASACYGTTVANEGGGTTNAVEVMHHRAVYNGAAAPGSTYTRITRTSATTWSMVSDGGCVGPANVAGVRSQDLTIRRAPLVDRGLFEFQFSLIMRLK